MLIEIESSVYGRRLVTRAVPAQTVAPAYDVKALAKLALRPILWLWQQRLWPKSQQMFW